MDKSKQNPDKPTTEQPEKDSRISTSDLVTTLNNKPGIFRIQSMMEVYRTPQGQVNHVELFSIPRDQRIAAYMEGPQEQRFAMQSGIATAISLMTDGEGISDNMAVNITMTICRDAVQDQISVQDVIVFVQDMVAGKYGKFYGAPTVSQVMDKFEQYRDERHIAMLNYREEEQAQRKVQGKSGSMPVPDIGGTTTPEQLNNQITQLKNQYGEF
jgi:hypothetical protein